MSKQKPSKPANFARDGSASPPYEISRRVAHDVKAPIRQIAQLLELFVAENRDRLDEDALFMLGLVQEKAKYLGDVSQSLRAYSDALCRPLDIQPVDLGALLLSAMEGLPFDPVLSGIEEPVIVKTDPAFFGLLVQQLFSLRPLSLLAGGRVEVSCLAKEEAHPIFRLVMNETSDVFDFQDGRFLSEFEQYNSDNISDLLSLHQCNALCNRLGLSVIFSKNVADHIVVDICL
ncbi:hypothetical protein [uncultured Cohaesibacter sp.]|uniref:hypothetical protein n=1 Tax=uncultured Cohaesibacter sp. TaxID=1002546 RepID=UPI0029C68413|nr:hypothetical protein [uncultured Cohaesibacter sp.]